METQQVIFDRIDGIEAPNAQSLADEVIVFEINRQTHHRVIDPAPMRFETVTIILCLYGESTVSVNYKPYRLTKGSMLGINSHHIVSDLRMSNVYEGYAMFISPKLIASFTREVPSIKKLIMDCFSRPIHRLDDEELGLMVGIIKNIHKKLTQIDHVFQKRIVHNEVSNFLLEAANIHVKKIEAGSELASGRESDKDEVVARFVSLVFDNCKTKHEVAFYAEALHMTPGNLSRIMAAASGKSPLKWISDALVAEAKILLRRPDTNVQQVSEELNFGDQSSFGKFFKKHTGQTPLEYKKNYINA